METKKQPQDLTQWLPGTIIHKFEIYNYNHAAEILSQSFPQELKELVKSLNSLTISKEDIIQAGGSESPIPPKFSQILEPLGWKEIRISGDLLIKFFPRKGIKKGFFSDEPYQQKTTPSTKA